MLIEILVRDLYLPNTYAIFPTPLLSHYRLPLSFVSSCKPCTARCWCWSHPKYNVYNASKAMDGSGQMCSGAREGRGGGWRVAKKEGRQVQKKQKEYEGVKIKFTGADFNQLF
jgi:hypothetical protein